MYGKPGSAGTALFCETCHMSSSSYNLIVYMLNCQLHSSGLLSRGLRKYIAVSFVTEDNLDVDFYLSAQINM